MPDHSTKPALCFGVACMASLATVRIGARGTPLCWVVITALAMQGVQGKYLTGGKGNISKPFGRQGLIDFINKHIA